MCTGVTLGDHNLDLLAGITIVVHVVNHGVVIVLAVQGKSADLNILVLTGQRRKKLEQGGVFYKVCVCQLLRDGVDIVLLCNGDGNLLIRLAEGHQVGTTDPQCPS